MTSKQLVKAFYDSDLANNLDALDMYLHKDCKLHWHSSQGFKVLNLNQIKETFKDVYKSYNSLRMQISHMFEEGNSVVTRYTIFGRTIETNEDEQPLAHFITIWQIKDNKLHSGYEISQPADISEESLKTF